MTPSPGKRFFDLSTVVALGLTAVLLVSMPGGCGDSENGDEDQDTETEAVAEPTAPPIMEIVDPEPGEIDDAVEEPEDASEEEPPEEEPAEESEEAPEEETGNDVHDGTYVVQQGDTLYNIAVQFSVSMEDLMAANDMDDPNQLQVGQELEIPQ
jgi:nucleoid-associated protein YgaU